LLADESNEEDTSPIPLPLTTNEPDVSSDEVTVKPLNPTSSSPLFVE